jgi:hypothetical protein
MTRWFRSESAAEEARRRIDAVRAGDEDAKTFVVYAIEALADDGLPHDLRQEIRGEALRLLERGEFSHLARMIAVSNLIEGRLSIAP